MLLATFEEGSFTSNNSNYVNKKICCGFDWSPTKLQAQLSETEMRPSQHVFESETRPSKRGLSPRCVVTSHYSL